MSKYEMVRVEEMPYLYEERSCSMDPQDVGANMAEVFQNVDAFVRENGITSARDVLSAYYTYDPERMTFRAGVSVSAEDAKRAERLGQGGRVACGRSAALHPRRPLFEAEGELRRDDGVSCPEPAHPRRPDLGNLCRRSHRRAFPRKNCAPRST